MWLKRAVHEYNNIGFRLDLGEYVIISLHVCFIGPLAKRDRTRERLRLLNAIILQDGKC
jgi:hypothetical protein